MYIPAHFAAGDATVHELLTRHGAADLITLTWNYVTAHVYGRLVVHDDPAWVEDVVRRLTAKHEAARRQSPGQAPEWSVDDAPRTFIEGQLRAIVGLELRITRIEAKAKLSQNRPETDVPGIVAGLSARGDERSAQAVEQARSGS
jgi:transcriptional regulator